MKYAGYKGQRSPDSTYMKRYLEQENSERQKVKNRWFGGGGSHFLTGTVSALDDENDSGDGCTRLYIYLMSYPSNAKSFTQ